MSNEIYHNNLAVLKARFPEVYNYLQRYTETLPFSVECFLTRCGQTNVRATLADGRRIAFYEAENILDSAEQAMAGWQLETQDILFFSGMGLGYYPLAAATLFGSRPSIVIIEHSAAVFELALKSVDLRPLLNYAHLAIFIGNHVKAADIVDKFKFSIFLGKQRVVTHAASGAIFGEYFEDIERDLKDGICLTKDLWQTNKSLGRDMLSHLMSNLSSLLTGVPIGKMRGALAGLPALCVSAGPSLDEAVPIIRELQNKMLIVAMDSAVSTLIPAGIRPHIVATCDTRKINFEKLRPYLQYLRDSILVFALESNPDNVRVFLGARRLAVASDSIFVSSWLEPALKLDCNLPVMSTVSHTAIYTMMALGADPIIVAGMDMAFPRDKSHAVNAVSKYNMGALQIIEGQGTNGLPVRTYRPMIDYTRQLESVIAASSQRFVNTCLRGMYIQGMEIKSLKEMAETEFKTASGIHQALAGLGWKSFLTENNVIDVLTEMRKQLEIYQERCAQAAGEADRLITCLQLQGCEECLESRAEQRMNHFERFQEENQHLIQMLLSTRLEKMREIEIRRLKLIRDSKDMEHREKTEKKLQLIKDDLTSQTEAATFFLMLIEKCENFYRNIRRIKCEVELDRTPTAKLLELARLYSRQGEILFAEQWYLQAIQNAPQDVQIYLELARMYCELKLWAPAQELLQRVCRAFPENEDAVAMQDAIDSEISKIMQRAQFAWAAGDKATAQRLLNEYSLLFPDDEHANQLSKKFWNRVDPIASDSPSIFGHLITEDHVDKLLVKAAEHIENLEFERAVGIIEGLIEKIPQKAAVLREKIGDCRMLQKDYKSAVWHYIQAFKLAPHVYEIKEKIDKASKTMGALTA